MKGLRLVTLLLCAALLTGCDAFDGQYVRVTPHAMQPSKSQTETAQAENYTELRNILVQMAASGTESGVILVPDYPEADLSDGLSIARRHVCSFDPVGSYALEGMTYEIGKKNGTPAVAVELSYRHSRSDIRGIVKLGSPEEIEGAVLKALENLDARKVLLVANYEFLSNLSPDERAIFEEGFQLINQVERDAWAAAVEEAKNKAENEQHVNFLYPDTAPFQEAMAPLHSEVLSANPELQPVYDLIQEYNAEYTSTN